VASYSLEWVPSNVELPGLEVTLDEDYAGNCTGQKIFTDEPGLTFSGSYL
jgi:hypothetical protein